MNRCKWTALLLTTFLLVGLIPTAVFAGEGSKGAGVDFELEGYYRVRYDNHFNPGWAFATLNDDDSDWYSYFDQRMRLTPTLRINEKIRLVMQLDILRNVNWGDNTQSYVPTAMVTRNPSNTTSIEQVTIDNIAVDTGNIFSQETSNTNANGEEVDPIQVTRVYGEVILPIGHLRVGRQPDHFGLGIFANAGLGIDDDFGDTYDRALFGSRIGPWIPIFMYDKVVEDSIKVADTDVNQLIWDNLFKDITWGQSNSFEGGARLLYRFQQSTSAKLFVYDAWLKFQMAGFRLEAEGVIVQGQMTVFDDETVRDLRKNDGLPVGVGGGKIIADAYMMADQLWYESDTWGVGGEFGFSSPSDPNPEAEYSQQAAENIAEASALASGDPDSPQSAIDFANVVVQNQSAFGNHLYTFPFDPDYSVDLVIWEILMGGSVKNGTYAKVGGYINPIDLMQIRLDVIKSWINESGKGKDGKDAGHDLGWEADLGLNFTAADHFIFGMQFGYAWTGEWFKDVYTDVKNVYTFQTSFGFEF